MLWALAPVPAGAADQPSTGASPQAAATPNFVLSLEGRIKHPQRFDIEALRKLPAESLPISFQTERGTTAASFAATAIWW
jgi:DMSO/TMAO reductase YedYZ molybdopterin-dependent catalytic subunit